MCSYRINAVKENVKTPTQTEVEKMCSYCKVNDSCSGHHIGYIHRHDTFNVTVQENVGLILGQSFSETKCAIE